MPRNDNVQILLGLQQLRGCVSISVFSFRFPFPVSGSFSFPAFPYAHILHSYLHLKTREAQIYFTTYRVSEIDIVHTNLVDRCGT